MDSFRHRDAIIAYLEEISRKLGDVYAGMAEQYPMSFQMLDDKVQSLKSDGHGDSDTFCGLQKMEDALEMLKNTVQSEGGILSGLSRKDETFLDKLEAELNTSRQFEKFIDRIDDDSAELEVISLNAMVTALKAGKNGGAFPYITEELQKISRESASHSVQLKKNGTLMDSLFRSFLEKIHKEKQELKSATQDIHNIIHQMMDLHMDYRDQLVNFGENLHHGVADIKRPLYLIVQEVQKHDIIRQSIDHVILSLKEREEPGSTVESQLDSLSYMVRIYQLCFEILNDLLEDIKKTHQLFSTKSADFSSLFQKIEILGSDFHNQNTEDSYSMKIQEYEFALIKYSSAIKKGYSRGYLKKSFDTILNEIQKLEEAADGYIRIISHIKTINISSRVEAAKLPNLLNMNIIIENINERVNSLENNVEDIVRIIKEFKSHTDSLFLEFYKDFQSDSRELDAFISDLTKGLENLKEAHGHVDECTSDVLRISGHFTEFYKRSQNDLHSMDNLQKDLVKTMDLVKKQEILFQGELEKVLKQSSYDSWNLESAKIRGLTEKFTIFGHKKIADRENALDMSGEGAQSGDVTLF